MSSPKVLLADDQSDVLMALRLLLKAEGFTTQTADSPEAILKAVQESAFNLILMDMNYTRDTTSGEEGLCVLSRLRALPDAPPVIVMTAWGSIELAVEAMRRGARDFVLKPWDNARLLSTLHSHLAPASAGKTVTEDLEIARQVQNKLLPQRHIPLRTLDYAGHCRQAGQIGGDYYDFLDLGAGQVGFVLADISGKGIGAALLMANLQAALRSLAWQATQNLGLLMRTVNLQFRESTQPHHFATVFFGHYDDSRRLLRYVNCGHNPPMLYRGSRGLDRLEPTAPVIGVLQQFQPEVAEVTLAPGDTLVIYSDGATDAPGASGEELGEAGFQAILEPRLDAAPEAIADEIVRYSGSQQVDDVTLVIARSR